MLMKEEKTADDIEIDVIAEQLMLLSEINQDAHVCTYFASLLIHKNPSHAVVLDIAHEFKIRGKYYFSIEILARLVPSDVRTPAILIRMGECYGLLGLHEKTIEYFEKAGQLSENTRQQHWYSKALVDAHLKVGDKVAAKALLASVLENRELTAEQLSLFNSAFSELNALGVLVDFNNGRTNLTFAESSTPAHAVTNELPVNILIVDSVVPRFDQDAGSVLMLGFIRSLVSAGYKVWFYTAEKDPQQKYVDRLFELNVRYITADISPNFGRFLELVEPEIDVFMLTRANVGGEYFDTIRNINPEKPIIFNSVDLHYLRMERLYESGKNVNNLYEAKRLKRKESYMVRNSDASIVISDAEIELLHNDGIYGRIWDIPIIVDFPSQIPSFKNRQNIAFVGSYVHTPNIDAIDYFCTSIWPSIYHLYGDQKFLIVGPKAPDRWMDEYHGKNNVEVIGFVEDLDSFLSEVKCTVVPLRFGAGQKGKIATSLAHGVPCIATEIGIEGMDLTPNKSVLTSDKIESWQENIANILSDEDLWNRLSTNGHELAFKKFSEESVGTKLLKNIDDLLAAA